LAAAGLLRIVKNGATGFFQQSLGLKARLWKQLVYKTGNEQFYFHGIRNNLCAKVNQSPLPFA
jgi:hypothetical protein